MSKPCGDREIKNTENRDAMAFQGTTPAGGREAGAARRSCREAPPATAKLTGQPVSAASPPPRPGPFGSFTDHKFQF
jgi:hypothetical protein